MTKTRTFAFVDGDSCWRQSSTLRRQPTKGSSDHHQHQRRGYHHDQTEERRKYDYSYSFHQKHKVMRLPVLLLSYIWLNGCRPCLGWTTVPNHSLPKRIRHFRGLPSSFCPPSSLSSASSSKSSLTRSSQFSSRQHDNSGRRSSAVARLYQDSNAENDNYNHHQPNHINNNNDNIRSLLQQFAHDMNKLSQLRPNDSQADPSLARDLVSRGRGSSSYTRLWTTETWQQHSQPQPHRRYVRHVLKWRHSATASRIMPTILGCVVWSTFVASTSHYFGGILSSLATTSSTSNTLLVLFKSWWEMGVRAAPAAVSSLSAPLALLLTLRANQSMSRLLEARLAWGRVMLHCQTMATMARCYLWQLSPPATLLLARHLALIGWMLKARVRGEADETEQVLATLLQGDDLEWILRQPRTRTANALLARSRQIVKSILLQETTRQQQQQDSLSQTNDSTGLSCSSLLLLFEEKIQELEGIVGTCNRLLTSPIPPTYTRHLSRVLSMWLCAFPVSLLSVAALNSATTTTAAVIAQKILGPVLATSVAAYVLVGIDEVGMEIENAFRILPLQEIAATAQAMVRQQFLSTADDINSDEGSWNGNEMPRVLL